MNNTHLLPYSCRVSKSSIGRCGRFAVASLAGLGLAFAFLVVMRPPAARAAGPWYVWAGAPSGANCLTPTTPCDTIQNALSLASPGDTIYVGKGTYTGSGANVIVLSKAATLSGGWNLAFNTQNETTIIDGQGARRGVLIAAGVQATLSTISIQNGFTDSGGLGGGIFADLNSSVSLVNVTVANSTAGSGGAIYATGDLRITDGVIENNQCTHPGCIGAGVGTMYHIWVSGTRFSNNTGAQTGGGLYVGELAVIEDAVFDGNASNGFGGGLFASRLVLTDTTFTNNSAGFQGGGLYVFAGATLLRPIAMNNQAINEGGGATFSGVTTVIGGEFRDNRSLGAGGGGIAGLEPLTLIDTAVLSNTALTAGGGIRAFDQITVTGGRVEHNQADWGGGLYMSGTSSRVQQATIMANTALVEGGGIAITDTVSGPSSLTINNTLLATNLATVSGNELAYNGGIGSVVSGYHNTFASTNGSTGAAISLARHAAADSLILFNSIFHDYEIGVETGAYTATAQLTGVLWSNVLTPTQAGNSPIAVSNAVTGPAAFVNAGSSDYHITISSAAFDGGVASPLATDIDGQVRPLYASPDLGADELDLATDLAISVTRGPAFAKPGDPITFTLAYTNVGARLAYAPIITNVVETASMTDLSYTSSGAAITATGALTYSWQTANLAPGAGGIITITAKVGNGVSTPTTINNTAQIASWVGDPNTANNSGSAGLQVDAPISGLAAQTNAPKPPNSAVTFTATVTTGTSVTYAWAFGDGTTGSGSPATHAYSALGNFTATLTATNPLGSSVITIPVTVVDVPISGLALNGPASAVIFQPTTYTASITQGSNVTYAWEIDGVAAGTGSSPALTFTTLGNRSVKVTASNSQGSQSTSVTVTVAPIRLYFASMMK